MLRTIVAAASLALAACAGQPPRAAESPVSGQIPISAETLISGETMGSAWTVKLAGALPIPAEELRAGVQSQFDTVNLALSTYRADSALSRFNDDDRGEWVGVDPELGEVLEYALSLAERSDGAYDVTVGPLVNLWGFGPERATRQVPDAAAIDAARARVGWRGVEVDLANSRARKRPGMRVDLSSLGKGRGVDRVANYLDSRGVANYLIDLSGKLRARGRNARGQPWRVAVEHPSADVSSAAPSIEPAIIELHGESVATAGDYRRFFESGGRHYSHIIDPRTGFPVAHNTVSATVIASDCMQADALATVLMVMPPMEALALANALRLRALLIGQADGKYRVRRTAGWPGP
ncbi:MAG TPA: FAD:protein FMN transferase [Steroidobacteraceae bacterium]|nr:FAD:protein FMN transferase [Steroidobacteraceae bacterium]